MESTNAFDGDDSSGAKCGSCRCDRRLADAGGLSADNRHRAGGVCREPDGWSACGAGIWLGMEPPRGRIPMLRLACRAHREGPHGRPAAVVGQRVDDREPRAAVGAVDEGAAMPSIGGIAQLGKACPAGGDVGWHDGPSRPHRTARRLRRRWFVVGFVLPRASNVQVENLHLRGSCRHGMTGRHCCGRYGRPRLRTARAAARRPAQSTPSSDPR
jgi:hypothetical protein